MGILFDPARLESIARKGVGLPFEEMCAVVRRELAEAYPGHIATNDDWVFNLAAGATGIMNVLHGSLSEYLLIFGSPVGTEAFSGRYHLDIYDYVMAGEMWTYTEDRPGTRVVTGEGDWALLPRGKVKGFRFEPGCWVLEYGRGLIPTALPTALSDAIVSAMDPAIVVRTFQIYGGLVVRELLQGKL